MKKRVMTIAIAVVVAFVLIMGPAMPVSAAATVTPAGGGDAISADDFSTGAWTTLTAIVITEGAAGDIAVGDFVLTIPSGFEFDITSAPDVAVTGTGLAADSLAAITATTITVTVTSASTAAGTLTIGGTTPIKVRPTQGTPLASGNILMTSGTIAGVDGTTNFGTLTEVHGTASKFVIIDPTDGTVDAPITVTVQLQDQYGNIVTTGADKDKDVTLTADGSATGAGLVNIINGVGTIDISDQVAETVNLGLTDSQATLFDVTSTQDVVFAHGVATKFVIINPTDGTVDAPITVTVQLQDQYGNIVTTGADKDKDVTLTADGSATGAGLFNVTNGVGTIDISDQVAETVNLGLTDTESTTFDVTSTQDVVFAHGVATKFVIINPTDGTVDAPITVTVQLQDQYGNIVTTGADKDKDVTLTADGSATGAGLVNVTNGVGTIDISDQVAETVNLGLTDSQATLFDVTSTQDVVFAHGAINYYTVTSVSYAQVAGVAFSVTVTAYDQYGNMVMTDSSTQVTMSSSSATMAFDGDGNGTFGEVGDDGKTLSAGTFDIQARDISPGTGVTITATDSNSKTGTSSPYAIYALGGGGGGVPKPPPLELEINLGGNITSVDLDQGGVLLEGVTATSPDGRVTLTIAEGTQLLEPDGDPLSELTVETMLDPPHAPDGYQVIVAFDFGPGGTTFSPPIDLTIRYDSEELPEGVNEEDLAIGYYDSDLGEWVLLPSVVDTGTQTATSSVGHFTIFAVIGIEAAAFDLADLSTSPSTVNPGESVTISAEVANTGGLEGSYTVTLLIDGVEEANHEVTLGPGASDTVTFAVTRQAQGTYSVEIDGLTGEFTVSALPAPFNWPLLVGIISGLVVAVLISWLIMWWRRSRPHLGR